MKRNNNKCHTDEVKATRLESDLLGGRDIPNEAYWGVHTLRAVENFPISGVPIGHYRSLVRGLGFIKEASASANLKLGVITSEIAEPIIKACIEVRDGKFDDQFVVDAIQGGAGTSTNIYANELICNPPLVLPVFYYPPFPHFHPLSLVISSQSTFYLSPTPLIFSLIFYFSAFLLSISFLCSSIVSTS